MSRPKLPTLIEPMRLALRLARRGYGLTSPNPMVGAVLVKGGREIGRGWHRRAGGAHAEIEALADAQRRGHSPRGATLYVTLEPCCTHGQTPPCTEALIAGGIRRVVTGAVDPNPKHAGRGFKILSRAGIAVTQLGAARSERGVYAASLRDRLGASDSGGTRHSVRELKRRERRAPWRLSSALADECARLNEAFNHWIVHRTPFITVKAAMTLDGKIGTASGESKWITGGEARAYGMKLRQGSDAILVGINTILADDPSLTFRGAANSTGNIQPPTPNLQPPRLRRIVLDSLARTPLASKVVSDEQSALTTVVVSRSAPRRRVAALARKVRVLVAPLPKSSNVNRQSSIDLPWLLRKLGAENVTSLLVEGGGEVNASFLLDGFTQRVAFFYAPKILGGRDSRKGVAGDGARNLSEVIQLHEIKWRQLGTDLLLTARVGVQASACLSPRQQETAAS